MSKKVLFITEGPIDELRLISSICRDLGLIETEREFYSYKTDFHQFARIMLPNKSNEIEDNIDVLLTIKSHEKDSEKREVLSGKYTDTFIIFDFDPHVNTPEFEKIHALASFFTDSSDMGRLFINYPMMQSYRHLTCLPDIAYEHRIVNLDDIYRYKDIVSKEGIPELIRTHEYTHIQLLEIACHNYCKREKMLGRKYEISSSSSYNGIEDVKILEKQISDFKKNGQCSVLNTSSLIYFDYSPKKIFDEINRHRNRFRI